LAPSGYHFLPNLNKHLKGRKYSITEEATLAAEERMANLRDCPPPRTISQLRPFLGMLNFYRRFLPQAAAAPQASLHDVLSGPRIKGSQPIGWTP
jgi:hypothetical protein